jgi:hypothetical protein
MLQPVYGYLSDRLHRRLFSVLAPAGSAHRVSSPFRKLVLAADHSPDRKGGGPLADAWGFQHSKLPK